MLRTASLMALITVSLLSTSALGQAPPSGPCPPGAVPIPGQGRCGSPAEAAANRGSGNSAARHTEVWENRHGALISDSESGNLYPIENETSKRRAINAGLKNCGQKSCYVAVHVRNACIASAWGNGILFSRGGDDKAAADSRVLRECREKSNECELKYSGCSFPVRVR